jgi:hypothetical protein
MFSQRCRIFSLFLLAFPACNSAAQDSLNTSYLDNFIVFGSGYDPVTGSLKQPCITPTPLSNIPASTRN